MRNYFTNFNFEIIRASVIEIALVVYLMIDKEILILCVNIMRLGEGTSVPVLLLVFIAVFLPIIWLSIFLSIFSVLLAILISISVLLVIVLLVSIVAILITILISIVLVIIVLLCCSCLTLLKLSTTLLL